MSVFEQIPGLLVQIAVGSFVVWGIDSDGHIFQFKPNSRFRTGFLE